jgi:hypothetical protein
MTTSTADTGPPFAAPLMHVDAFPPRSPVRRFPGGDPLRPSGLCPAAKGTSTAGFQALLGLMRDGKAWVKRRGLFDVFASWVPDEELRRKTLVDNPVELHDFS